MIGLLAALWPIVKAILAAVGAITLVVVMVLSVWPTQVRVTRLRTHEIISPDKSMKAVVISFRKNFAFATASCTDEIYIGNGESDAEKIVSERNRVFAESCGAWRSGPLSDHVTWQTEKALLIELPASRSDVIIKPFDVVHQVHVQLSVRQ